MSKENQRVPFEDVFSAFLDRNQAGDAVQALGLLKLYVQNILKSPQDPKFRKVTTSNVNYVWKIAAAAHGHDLIRAIGFVPGGGQEESIEFSSADVSLLASINSKLESEEKRLKALISKIPRQPCQGEIKLTRAVHEAEGSTRFQVGFADSIGKRPRMEDEIVVLGMGPRSLPHEDYFAVFDGHSGAEAAVLAAKTLHSRLDKFLRTSKSIPEALSLSFVETSQAMAQKSMRCGTCALVAFISGNRLYVANLGDSRAVMGLASSDVKRISTDHRPNNSEEADRILKLGGKITQSAGVYRVQGDITVTRALGDAHLKPFISDLPDVFEVPIDDTVDFLILACDGIWDELTDEDGARIVRTTSDPLKACSMMLDEALRRGSTDNMSVIVVYLRPRSDWKEEKRT